MKFLYGIAIGVALNAVSLYLLTLVLKDISYSGGITLFVVAGVFIGFVNSFVKPFIKILSLPFIVLTAGLFLVVLNAGVLFLLSYFLEVASFRDLAITFPNILTYVIGAVVFGLINWVLHLLFK